MTHSEHLTLLIFTRRGRLGKWQGRAKYAGGKSIPAPHKSRDDQGILSLLLQYSQEFVTFHRIRKFITPFVTAFH